MIYYSSVSKLNPEGPQTPMKLETLARMSWFVEGIVVANIDLLIRPRRPFHSSSGSDRTCHTWNLKQMAFNWSVLIGWENWKMLMSWCKNGILVGILHFQFSELLFPDNIATSSVEENQRDVPVKRNGAMSRPSVFVLADEQQNTVE